MAQEPFLPVWGPEVPLREIAADLRATTFASQDAAARYFDLVHTTVTRYEAFEDILRRSGIKPPLGYLAALMVRVTELNSGEQGATRVYHQELVARLDILRKRFYGGRRAKPIQNWEEVEGLAKQWQEATRSRRARGVQTAEATAVPHAEQIALVTDPLPLPISVLPNRPYRDLVGRESYLSDILTALADREGRWLVSIDGMGGIGKTALARKAADRCLAEHLFDLVIWLSATTNGGVDRTYLDGKRLEYEDVLDAIARELGALDVLRLSAAEKETRVHELLHTKRMLLVLDNLETAAVSQAVLIAQLQPLLNPSKALLTSRRRFSEDVCAIHLTGLDEVGSIRFIRQEALEKGIGRIKKAGPRELKQITRVTGGSPLALKLVIGQLSHLPLSLVLKQLQEVQAPALDSEEDDYYRLYRFIFNPSWRLLSEESQNLLIGMGIFPSGVGGTIDAISATSGLVELSLARSLNDLWKLSFLEVGESRSLTRVRYYLHALTRYFVLTDIVRVWNQA